MGSKPDNPDAIRPPQAGHQPCSSNERRSVIGTGLRHEDLEFDLVYLFSPSGVTPGSANVGVVRSPSESRYAAGRLSPLRRVSDLRRLRDEQFDVLVIGGGVTGAGAALDAASRGLKVALVEARDLAAGTSSRSSKLIHGGLRYLEQLELHLVHEALTERGLLTSRLAPHLVRPVPILVPLPAASPAARVWQRAYYGLGVAAYDVFAGLFGSGRGWAQVRRD